MPRSAFGHPDMSDRVSYVVQFSDLLHESVEYELRKDSVLSRRMAVSITTKI